MTGASRTPRGLTRQWRTACRTTARQHVPVGQPRRPGFLQAAGVARPHAPPSGRKRLRFG